MANEGLKELEKRIRAPKPLRVLINAAATAAWYDIREDKRRKEVIDRLQEVCRGWKQMPGVRFITSFDDDLFMVGDPRGFQRWSIFIILEVEEIDSVVAMIDACRHGEVKLNQYFTMAATIGRPFWPIEPPDGSK